MRKVGHDRRLPIVVPARKRLDFDICGRCGEVLPWHSPTGEPLSYRGDIDGPWCLHCWGKWLQQRDARS